MAKIALDPERGGGMCIMPEALKKGDLIVSTTGANVSGVIRLGTGSPVSHAMLYIGNGTVIEAVGSGVRRVALKEAVNDASLAVAYRMKNLSDEEASQVVDFATLHIGKPYDYAGVGGAGIARNTAAWVLAGAIVCLLASAAVIGSPDRFFCSELVLAAFASVNKPLTSRSPSVSVPHDIPRAYSQGILDYAGHLVLG